MASHPPSVASTKETTNYARLCRLLIDIGAEALRDKFNDIHKPATLYRVLNNVKPKLHSLRSKGILNPIQWGYLYPAIPSKVSSANFDISLLYILLANICGLPTPATGWKNSPATTDQSLGADIIRIKNFRNSVYAHVLKASIDDTTFNSYWSDIRDILVRLGGASYDEAITTLETECMDPSVEEDYKNLLKEWKKQDDYITEQLDLIVQNTGKTHELLQNLKDQMAAKGGDSGELIWQ